MPRGFTRTSAILILLAVCSTAGAEAERPLSQSPFKVRAVKLGLSASDPKALEFVQFASGAGFNALWVYAHQAGLWTFRDAPGGPHLDPSFVKLARYCRERGMRLFVSINPVAASAGKFVFTDPDGERRLRSFIRMLHRQAGVRDFVLSFDDQPRSVFDLRDILKYGRGAAPAHLDLARRVLRAVPRRGTAWLCAAAYADWHLDEYEVYAEQLLQGLPALSKRVGIVWTGPDVISESIRLDDLANIRKMMGGRELLLYDNYPVNDDYRRDALALILGPLRERDPRLHEIAGVYLACPMTQVGASRLPLLTVADYLNDPSGYDPDTSWRRAIERLAGDNPRALDALKTQAMEWGGWVGTLNYHHREDANPYVAARDLRDPAMVASWTWTAKRYPERMAALRTLPDHRFRDDLLEVMARRLAVARAVPLVVELAKRSNALEPVDAVFRQLSELRLSVAGHGRVLDVLDRFLEASGVPQSFLAPASASPAPRPVPQENR